MAQTYTRKYPRIAADFIVQFSLGSKTYRERASAVGGGGLFLCVKRDPPLEMGMELKVQFRPAKHLPIMEAASKVCYLVPGEGAAVEFIEIDPEHRRLLLQYIHNRTGNRRKHPRASLATQIQCEESMSLAFARDISVGGMFIETDQPMPVGSRITLRFNLDENEPIMVASAEVTYQVGRMGVGVKFIDVSTEDLERIENFVGKSVPQPEKPARTQAPQ
ncbi:MAG TPA: PilZ domain-containing protein [Terriglobia bacterium]|nr:PilZ domain-containing protein [Terriglobia bacterium]